MWWLLIPKPAVLSSASITSHVLFPLSATPFSPPSFSPSSSNFYQFLHASRSQASLPWYSEVQMLIHHDSVIPRDYPPSKHLSHWTTVINWALCCLYLTRSFLKARTVFYLSLHFHCAVPVIRGDMCLFHEWAKFRVPKILFLPSNFCLSLFVHRHILSRLRGRESSRSSKINFKHLKRRWWGGQSMDHLVLPVAHIF